MRVRANEYYIVTFVFTNLLDILGKPSAFFGRHLICNADFLYVICDA